MLYAQVVLGLAVRGAFDYIVPPDLSRKIKAGCRVWVSFRTQRKLGYVVALSKKTNIKNLKPVLALIDELPILDKGMLALTREVSDYYCCSWGEAIETALPEELRKGKAQPLPADFKKPQSLHKTGFGEVVLVHDLEGSQRWDIYLKMIEESLADNKPAIFIAPDKISVLRAKEIISAKIKAPVAVLYRKQPRELYSWLKIKEGEAGVVIGMRSVIFAPLNNLGLVIIDEEEDPVYKQEQVPHYHSREVALMRAKIECARLVLGSFSPSLESFCMSKKSRVSGSGSLTAKYIFFPRKAGIPALKIIDMKRLSYLERKDNPILSKFAQDFIYSRLNAKSKTLLFLNRKGFATLASCLNCGTTLKCPRCNVNLVYHFYGDTLSCHFCNFKMLPPKICPNCNSGYIKFTGIGTQKLESELSRIFPQARIKRIDEPGSWDISEADMFVATSSVVKQPSRRFDLVVVLCVDNSLNRIDFRSAEKTFALLAGLLRLADKELIIQTYLPGHYCFRALEENDVNIFYDEELKQRRQLGFPPYRHLGLVKLRSKKEERAKEASLELFERLNKCNSNRGIRIISVNPAHPAKLRGSFYWQLLISSGSAKKLSAFLRINLKDFSHSGIIVTVDIDPL